MQGSAVRTMAFIGLALVVGFLVGTWRAGATVQTGRADLQEDGGGSISTDDWTYGFNPGVTWVDSQNTWHHGDESPECLGAARSVEAIRFAAVEVNVEGSTWRPVVWIDCRSINEQ